jgi:hypothetical protein
MVAAVLPESVWAFVAFTLGCSRNSGRHPVMVISKDEFA